MESDALNIRLKQLGLHTISSLFEEEAKKAGKLKLSYTEYLRQLVEAECLARTDRSIRARIQKAKFPFIRTLEAFDFGFQPKLSAPYIKELGTLSFLEKAENVLLLGPPGTGKTHLAIALGVRACQARKRTIYFSFADLLEQLVVAKVSRILPRTLQELSRLDLIIIDELGYETLDRERAHLFFQVIAKRYERGSVILTSNKPFEEWGTLLGGDEAAAVGLLDRLLHHSHPIVIDGSSYRTKDKVDMLKKRKSLSSPSLENNE